MTPFFFSLLVAAVVETNFFPTNEFHMVCYAHFPNMKTLRLLLLSTECLKQGYFNLNRPVHIFLFCYIVCFSKCNIVIRTSLISYQWNYRRLLRVVPSQAIIFFTIKKEMLPFHPLLAWWRLHAVPFLDPLKTRSEALHFF